MLISQICIRRIFIIIIALFFLLSSGCSANTEQQENDESIYTTEKKDAVKDYDLPISKQEMDRAFERIIPIMQNYHDIYITADKGNASNIVLSNENVKRIQVAIASDNNAVAIPNPYVNMLCYEKIDDYLKSCQSGKPGNVLFYEVGDNGGLTEYNFSFDGKDMYVMAFVASWIKDYPQITYSNYSKINEWRYTDTGWFCYELCVPEYPEVTEVVDGSVLIRVKPMTEECIAASQKYVLGVAYQGNNLLCSNWDVDNLEKLDYNGLYEYLFRKDTGERFQLEEGQIGILEDEFETLIMKYIPVSRENLRKYAVYDEEKHIYDWARLGCGNYAPTQFGTSYPEVTDIKANPDGTITLTVNAVCEMILNNEAVITHELTIKEESDGSFMYMGNYILNDGINNIPRYQYRIQPQ